MSFIDNLGGLVSDLGASVGGLFSANESRFLLTIKNSREEVQVLRFNAEEALSTAWSVDITLVSEASDLNPELMIGSEASLTLLGSNVPGYFHGKIWQFRRQTQGTRLTQYQLIMRPALAWLDLGRNQRIFQHKTIPDIIRQLFQEQHIASDQVLWKLTATYQPREYCVQYGESDLQFIHRLLGEEGIHYHFSHTEKNSQLIISDHPSGWSTGLNAVQYKPGTGQAAADDTLQSLRVRHEVSVNATSHRHFDFHQPLHLTDVQQQTPAVAGEQPQPGASSAGREHLNHYFYQSDTADTSQAALRAQRHLEARQREVVTAQGRGNLPQLHSGWLLPVIGHNREEFNTNWLLTSLTVSGEQPQVLEEFSGGQSSLNCQFSAIPWDTLWRPDFVQAKPRLCGVQTATVTGPAGEEIYTDAFGRVKVQFHWDREGKEDEKTSCWIRVMHDWAGNGYGVVRLPRIGQEVQVSFEEGDPDKPLITGCLHNAQQKTPWEQPAHMTRSGLRTASSPGGQGTNELRFEDKKGHEELRWQAEKDWDAKIQASSHSQVNGSHERAIGGNDYREIKGEQHVRLEANLLKEIKLDQHGTIHGSAEQHIEQKSLIQASQSVAWQSQNQMIFHAGTEMTIKAAGSFIKLDPSGITLSGPMVTMNQGGCALFAGTEAAELPAKPAGAHTSGTGKVPTAKAPEKVIKIEPKKVLQMVYSD